MGHSHPLFVNIIFLNKMTVPEIIQNKNIKADRFGMAAISYIFKAFGDYKRSKEYWPWSDKINIPWEETQGNIADINNAISLLIEANKRINAEITDESNSINNEILTNDQPKTIREYKRRLNQIVTNLNTFTKSLNETDNINSRVNDRFSYLNTDNVE